MNFVKVKIRLFLCKPGRRMAE